MIRTLIAILAALVLCTTLCGCSGESPEDEAMTEKRDPPAKRAAPGTKTSLKIEVDPESPKQPPPAGE